MQRKQPATDYQKQNDSTFQGILRPRCASLNSAQDDARKGVFHRRHAFTLVEMLLVLVILATLAAIVIPKMAGRSQQAKVTAAQTQIASVELALDLFEVDNGYYPKSGGLGDLLAPPAGATNWRGPYLKKDVPLDPWGAPYTYEYPGKHSPDGRDLSSMGPDGRAGTDDDLNNWDAAKK